MGHNRSRRFKNLGFWILFGLVWLWNGTEQAEMSIHLPDWARVPVVLSIFAVLFVCLKMPFSPGGSGDRD